MATAAIKFVIEGETSRLVDLDLAVEAGDLG